MRARRKILSLLLVVTLMMTTLPAQLFATEEIPNQMPIQKVDKLNTETTTPAGVEVNQPVIFTGNGFEAEFKVVSKWPGAFNGIISIKNNTDKTIEDWTLEFDFDRNLQQFWTAQIESHEGNHYVIKNAG